MLDSLLDRALHDFPSLRTAAYERRRRLRTHAAWIARASGDTALGEFEPDDAPDATLAAATRKGADSAVLAMVRRLARTGCEPDRSRPPVLLVHGATAWRATFFEPHGGIARYLLDHFDVWTLDWRASKAITDPWADTPTTLAPPGLVWATFDDVIHGELPKAVALVRRETACRRPRLVGHCIGAALIAAAIARKQLGREQIDPRVVLAAMGLFYVGGSDTWLRAQERIDLAPQTEHWNLSFHDHRAWGPYYRELFKAWQLTPYPHCQNAFCRRISAVFGAPYRPHDIAYIHDDEAALARQFGVMPLTLLKHCARNVRRGWSGAWDASELHDRTDLDAAAFAPFALTLITGNENQLWHRDSVDRMHAWLQRENPRQRVRKHVFARYGHQDLWWSPHSAASDGVYALVLRALEPPPRT